MDGESEERSERVGAVFVLKKEGYGGGGLLRDVDGER